MPKTDKHPTCKRTYATLRIYHQSASPKIVSRILSLKPSNRQISGRIDSHGKNRGRFPLSGWFFTSEGTVESRDLRDHIEWLVDGLRAC